MIHTILATEKIVSNYDTKYFLFGHPNGKLLCDWFQKIDLISLNIEIKEPVEVLNFVSSYVKYAVDNETYGQLDFWPEDITLLFDTQKDDCDGFAVLTASILYSIGNPNVRLCAGGVNSPTLNHCFTLVMDGEDFSDAFIVDAAGNYFLEKLYRLKECPEYNLLVSAAPDGRMWVHGTYADELAKSL